MLDARHIIRVSLTNLGGVHLVDGNNELPDTEGEGEESVLAGLAILGDTSLELTGTSGDDEDSAVSLRGTSDHVLDEVTMSGGIDNLCRCIWLSIEILERSTEEH